MTSVRNLYLRCGHAETLVTALRGMPASSIFSQLIFVLSKVKCASTRCKFSPNHPANCGPPICRQTCNQ
ncbi:hypothetical protein C8R45DRAFT_835260 [Mycena sanguinolenta]|nr:hypothetical protein C8R45DRAFT_835260 [Mycena sanguinolenta]